MAVIILDPTEQGERRQARLAPRTRELTGMRLGLLANGKPGAVPLLEEVAALLGERHGMTVVRLLDKHDASRPARPEILRQLVEGCDAALTAIGD